MTEELYPTTHQALAHNEAKVKPARTCVRGSPALVSSIEYGRHLTVTADTKNVARVIGCGNSDERDSLLSTFAVLFSCPCGFSCMYDDVK